MDDRVVDWGSGVDISTRAFTSSEEPEDGGMGRAVCWVTYLIHSSSIAANIQHVSSYLAEHSLFRVATLTPGTSSCTEIAVWVSIIGTSLVLGLLGGAGRFIPKSYKERKKHLYPG